MIIALTVIGLKYVVHIMAEFCVVFLSSCAHHAISTAQFVELIINERHPGVVNLKLRCVDGSIKTTVKANLFPLFLIDSVFEFFL